MYREETLPVFPVDATLKNPSQIAAVSGEAKEIKVWMKYLQSVVL
jgi:hypothetical protein